MHATSKKTRILVADDHAIVREGYCKVLGAEPDFEIVAEAADGEEAVKLASQLRQSGIGVMEAIGNKSLKAQLRQANTLSARYAVIIGEQEVKSDTVILRDMSSAQQETITLTQLQQRLQ